MAVEPAGRIKSPGAGALDAVGPAEAPPPAPPRRRVPGDEVTAKFIQSILSTPERWGINE